MFSYSKILTQATEWHGSSDKTRLEFPKPGSRCPGNQRRGPTFFISRSFIWLSVARFVSHLPFEIIFIAMFCLCVRCIHHRCAASIPNSTAEDFQPALLPTHSVKAFFYFKKNKVPHSYHLRHGSIVTSAPFYGWCKLSNGNLPCRCESLTGKSSSNSK